MRVSYTYAACIASVMGTLVGAAAAADLIPRTADTSIVEAERLFRELPGEARRLTGPLFWLHGDESRERLEMYVGKIAEGGNGSFTAESRPHIDWLGEGWFRDLGICLEAARKHGLQMWIFDEKWWPSGEVAGQVPEQYGSKRLGATAENVTGPARITADGLSGPRFVAALAGRVTPDGIDGASLLDLSGSIRDGRLSWEAPAGEWRVMTFAWAAHKSGHRYLVDGASADAVEWYLRTVYQPHYDRFKDDFGGIIAGYFYDEPETHGDWGTEVMKVLAERKVDWKRALVAWKFKLAGEEQAAARYQYQDALAEAWGRTLFGGISRWCRDHRVTSIGHFLEHANGYLHPDLCAGNMFQLQKYTDMGGIDAVFDQFIWGQRAARDAPCWQTPKLGSSITHAYGKPDDVTMVEIFGARGQDLSYPEMKWWTDHMQVSGVNFIIPHSFNPRSPHDTDCPPYFYNGGFEPRWPLYRVYADYTSRLSLMLSGGRHVCPVAMLYLGGSAHVGRHVPPDAISEALQDALYDCDWLPYEVFEGDVQVSGRGLRLREEAYRALVVPPVEVIPVATLTKVRQFFEQGGTVIGHGFLPSKSATLGRTSAEVAALCEAIWGRPSPGLQVCKISPAGGRSYLLPEKPAPEQLRKVLAGDAGIHPTLEVLDGDTGHWLHVLHRVKAGRDLFFITNQNHTGEPRRFRFRATADGEPECWDAMRNEITAVQHQRQGARTEFSLTLHPNESVLIVFQSGRRPLPLRVEAGLDGRRIDVQRDPTPSRPEPMLDRGADLARSLEGCSWIWYPEDEPSRGVSPGTRYFRKSLALPPGRKVARAHFLGTTDNSMILYLNGQEAGRSDSSAEGWRRPVELDVAALLLPGTNQIAIAATNGADQPNPAGSIGRFRVEFDQGEPLVLALDGTWKAARKAAPGWTEAGFSDADWPDAKVVGPYGSAPWGRLGEVQVTLSPVKADPFFGHVDLAAGDLSRTAVYLEMDALAPEQAASVTINGIHAGGFIGAPLRLPVTPHLRAGRNEIRIEPFAPSAARLVIVNR